LLVHFQSLYSKLFTPASTGKETTLPEEENVTTEQTMYEFMDLYNSCEIVDYANMKDSADTILDELSSANVFGKQDEDSTYGALQPKKSHDLLVIETDEIGSVHQKLISSYILSSAPMCIKQKNKSPRNGETSRNSPVKSDGENKRGRPAIDSLDKKSPKVKVPKVKKVVVKEGEQNDSVEVAELC